MGQSTPFVNWLRRDIRNGNTPIVVFCGRQRSGKTAFAMRAASEVFPDKFKYANVVDTVEQFAFAMKNNKHNIIILDEASSALFVYDWNSYLHKIFSIIQDSQAYRHNVVFLVLPRITKLDNLTKFDIDAVVEMRKMRVPNESGKYEKKYFYKFLMHQKQYSSFKNRDPILTLVYDLVGPVPLPPPEIWNPYIDKGQQAFKEKILDDQLDMIIKKKNPIKVLARKAQLPHASKPQTPVTLTSAQK